MTRPFGLVLLLLMGGAVGGYALVRLLVAWDRRRPDAALQLQTPQIRFTGYDQHKAEAGAKRRGQTAAQMAEADRVVKLRARTAQGDLRRVQ